MRPRRGQHSEMNRNYLGRIRAALTHSPHFRDLASDELDGLARVGHVTRMRPGEACKGGLFLILEGRLCVCSVTAEGQEFMYALLGRGEFFGFSEILQRAPSPIQAHVTQRATLAVFPAVALRAFLDSRPTLWRHFAQLTYDRLVQTLLLARDISLVPLQQRLARRLLWQALNAGNGGPRPEPIAVHLSQTDLARMVGSARSRVNGALKELERRGMINVGYRSVQLKDLGALRSVAGPDSPG